jgi:hypothetical protein
MLPGQLDLFELAAGPMLTPAQRRAIAPKRKAKANGYAKRPGSGPQGETCKSCAHLRRVQSGARRTFRKCALLERNWTCGPGTDILASAPACSLWRPA